MKLILTFFLILQVFLLELPVYAFDLKGCLACHEATISAGDARIYLHSPFAQRQCNTCHEAEASSSNAESQKSKVQKSKKKERKKITWLSDSVITGTSHGFVLPGNKLGDILIVEKKRAGGRLDREEIAVPLLNTLDEVVDTGKPPIISDVRVLNVQRGVFLSVTVGWNTDSLTRPSVSYGENGLSQKSASSKRFSRQHRVTLYSLKPDKDYSFAVTSRDLFGRIQVSDPLTFSTEKPLTDPENMTISNVAQQSPDAKLGHRFTKLGQDYLLELSAPQPFLAFIGSAGKVRKQSSVSLSKKGSSENIEQHKNLSSESFISTKACRRCHVNQNVVTHPINVFPKPDMTIPPEYPTLPDGRISCVTCHSTHGSDYEYLAIKPGRRELCVGCHKDML